MLQDHQDCSSILENIECGIYTSIYIYIHGHFYFVSSNRIWSKRDTAERFRLLMALFWLINDIIRLTNRIIRLINGIIRLLNGITRLINGIIRLIDH